MSEIMFKVFSRELPIVEIILDAEGELRFAEHDNFPQGFQEEIIQPQNLMQEIMYSLAKYGCAYLTCERNKILVFKEELVTLIMNDVKYKGLNNKNTPILEIDGVRCSGYIEIALHLFGEVKSKGYMQKLIEPYIVEVDMSNPVVEKFFLIKKAVGYKGNKYPLIGYDHLEFKGISAIAKACPAMTEETKEAILQQIGWTKGKNRAEELVSIFKLEKEIGPKGISYSLFNPEVLDITQAEVVLPSQNSVIKYIKAHPQGGSLSKETAKKLFALIEK